MNYLPGSKTLASLAAGGLMLTTLAAGATAGAQYYPPVPVPTVTIDPAAGFDVFDVENYADTVNQNGKDVDGDGSDASPNVGFGGAEPSTPGLHDGDRGGHHRRGHHYRPLAHTGSETATAAALGGALISLGGMAWIKSRRIEAS